MIRRPPRSTRKESSAASDVYKRQAKGEDVLQKCLAKTWQALLTSGRAHLMIHPSRSGSNSPGDNLFSWLCAMADRECESRRSPCTAQVPKFSSYYIGRCMECLQQGEHLEVVIHTLHALLKEHRDYIKKQSLVDQSFVVRPLSLAFRCWLQPLCCPKLIARTLEIKYQLS